VWQGTPLVAQLLEQAVHTFERAVLTGGGSEQRFEEDRVLTADSMAISSPCPVEVAEKIFPQALDQRVKPRIGEKQSEIAKEVSLLGQEASQDHPVAQLRSPTRFALTTHARVTVTSSVLIVVSSTTNGEMFCMATGRHTRDSSSDRAPTLTPNGRTVVLDAGGSTSAGMVMDSWKSSPSGAAVTVISCAAMSP